MYLYTHVIQVSKDQSQSLERFILDLLKVRGEAEVKPMKCTKMAKYGNCGKAAF